ncbi:MAG: hypothetical protein LBL13_05410 [Bacteroidales bacterium]|nr:hypothetical protein [Bacteroidales bacterium]
MDAETFTTNGKNGIKGERMKGRREDGNRQQATGNKQTSHEENISG